MSNPGEADATPITGTEQLAEFLAVGGKPAAAWRIGTEHEKFGFRYDDLSVPPYAPGGIQAVLEGMHGLAAPAGGGEPIRDGANIIGLKLDDGAAISLEPAGQLELSGAPLADLHAVRAEMAAHFAAVRQVAEPLGLGFAPLGFHPLARREAMPWMPKSRYAIMRRYMPLRGTLGLDMMLRTCTVQVNLDFASEADMRRKLRVSLVLQPLATALFANSPFAEGRRSGFLSTRAQAWTDTDPDRTGIPAGALEPGYGFARYVDWLVHAVPMYFVNRGGRLIDVAGASFADFMAGRLDALPGERATLGDFADHLTTAFPDVRLKRFLEMRGADAGTPEMMLAQSAFWVGLLYDAAALDAAAALTADIGLAELLEIRAAVPRLGLATPFRAGTLRDLARDAVAIARQGLQARGIAGAGAASEAAYVEPLLDIAAGAPTQAEAWLERVERQWHGDVRPVLRAAAV